MDLIQIDKMGKENIEKNNKMTDKVEKVGLRPMGASTSKLCPAGGCLNKVAYPCRIVRWRRCE